MERAGHCAQLWKVSPCPQEFPVQVPDRCPDDAGEACQVPRMAEEDSPEDRASGVSDEEEFPSEEVGKGMSADGGAAGTEV